MNHFYRTIWSKASNSFVAVPENTASCGKASSSSKSAVKGRSSQKAVSCAVAAALLAMTSNAAFAVWVSGVNNFDGATIGVAGVIDGNGAGGYFVNDGITTISNATMTNFTTTGGAGSGGGAGFGGAVFVNSGASVTLNNVGFISNTAQGGDGGLGKTGGSLNGVVIGSAPVNGVGGSAAPVDASYVNGANGADGRNGSDGSAGGAGGNGGNGSDGSAISADTIKAAADAAWEVAVAIKDAIDAGNAFTAIGAAGANPFTISLLPYFGVESASLVGLLTASTIKAGIDIAYVTAISIDTLQKGTAGAGGAGGAGGDGGEGYLTLGGGQGGAGANGGNAHNVSGAVGGAGGDGGAGGIGGFGAGGGSGGDGGVDGSDGNNTTHAADPGAGGGGGSGGFGGGRELLA